MVDNIIKKIYDLPCWLVQQGHGSFLTFEFGQPYLEIREPKELKFVRSERIKRKFRYRQISIRGEWHLWIYCCSWEIYLDNKLKADSESSRRKIKDALKYISGQKIINIQIDSNTADTVFCFDLGGVIKTKHYTDGIYEQWLLYEPQGNVFAVRSDGMYSYHLGDKFEKDETWENISVKGD